MCRSRPLTRLTASTATLKSEIAALDANGNTNIHHGLLWGWRSLSPISVFADGVPYTQKNTTKVLVLMTDGMNTWGSQSNTVLKSNYSAHGYCKNADATTPNVRFPAANANIANDAQARAAMDALVRETCSNARSKVMVYTIGFSVATDPIDQQGLNLLADCAGSADRTLVANDARQGADRRLPDDCEEHRDAAPDAVKGLLKEKARLAAGLFASALRKRSVDLLFRLLVDCPRDRDRAEAIAVVDVVAELHHAFRRRPGGDVGPVDVDGLREPRVDALAAFDRLVDLVAAPARRVPEQEGDVVAHVLHPYAARRDEAEIVAEDALRGRVVHVDAVRVRDVDAHEAHRVEVGAGVLPEHVARRLVRVPVDPLRRDLLALRRVDADFVLGEVVRLLLHLRDQILLDDRSRDGPERVEVHLGDLGVHDRRLPVDLADAGGVAARDPPLLHRLDDGGRDVHDHVAVAEF